MNAQTEQEYRWELERCERRMSRVAKYIVDADFAGLEVQQAIDAISDSITRLYLAMEARDAR